MLGELAGVVAPAFISVAIGYFWARSGAAFDEPLVSRIVANVGVPCLTFYGLTTAEISPAALAETGVAFSLCIILCGLAGWAALALAGQPRSVYLPTLMFPNIGNIGIPICYYAFGAAGQAHAIATYTTVTVWIWTVGAWIASGSIDVRKILFSPAIISVFIAIAFIVTDATPPTWAANTTEFISGISLPLMLMTLGVSLARLNVDNVVRSFTLGAGRIALGAAAGFLVVYLLQIEGTARGVVLLQATMPPAVFAFVFAQIYDQRPEEVAGVIVASTLIAMVTIPLMVWYVLP